MGIKIYDIERAEYAEEKVCAEGSLRFMYESPAGRAATSLVFKRAFFSRMCGAWADSRASLKSAEKFARENGINMDESLLPFSAFKTFNDFFTRELKASARPVAGGAKTVSFPSDGRHLLVRNFGASDVFYAKGQRFDMAKFLGDKSLAARFEGGDMLVSRLSPLDYHRFHYPVSGEIAARRNVDGWLFSVSPIALSKRISIFWENRRVLNLIDSPELGLCAFAEIGATNVGSIVNFGKIGDRVSRGAQAGLFRFGGSCLVSIFPPSANLKWNPALVEKSAESVECYAHANTACAEISQ